jgi:hypothetical protein
MSIAYLLLAAASVHANTPQDVAIQALHNFGACIVERNPKGARELLGMDFRSPDYQKRLHAYAIGHDYCIPFNGSLGSTQLLLAGALAEGLLKTDAKAADLSQELAFDPHREPIAARSESEAMALCTVLKAPEATARILNTEPATDEEIAAMKPLGSVLGECLKKDTRMTLNKPALRSLLALAAWRIVNTPKTAAAQ